MDLIHLPEGWELDITDPGGGARGRCLHAECVVLIAPGLHPWQQRATYTHEVLHAHRGPVPGHMQAREEDAVERETARRLIPFADLVWAAQEIQDAQGVADRLEVPVSVLWVRLDSLHPAERHHLRRAIGGGR